VSNVSGARIGGLSDPDARNIALRMYKEFRNTKFDFVNVSKNTGMSIEYTQMIKNYLFRDFHVQPDQTERFLPAYDIAQSWKRLSSRDGRGILPHDIILLNHELLEIKILIENPGWLQVKAHDYASLTYNYQAASDQYYASIGVKVK
jgi:hypothetical protein